MAHLTIRLLDCTFAKPCQYFVSLQLDENKKRLRTKVSAETDKPTFEETFRTLDFEEDFAIMSPDRIQRTLTLDAFVVLARESATAAHQMLGSATVVLPDLSPRARRADAGRGDDAAAATWIFRGDESVSAATRIVRRGRRARGPRVKFGPTPPRLGRGSSVETRNAVRFGR